MNTFGERMKTRRKAVGFSNQTKLGEALGLLQSQVSNYEKGGQEPRTEMMVKIAEALHTTVDYLVGRTDDPEPPYWLSASERKVIDAYRRGDKDTILTLLSDKLLQAFRDDPGLLSNE